MATQQNPSSLLPFFRVPCTLESYYTVLFPHLLASKCMFMGADHASLTVNPQRQLADSNQCDSKFWFKLHTSTAAAGRLKSGLFHNFTSKFWFNLQHPWANSNLGSFKILLQFAGTNPQWTTGGVKSGLFHNFASKIWFNLQVGSPAIGQFGASGHRRIQIWAVSQFCFKILVQFADTTKWSGSEGTTVHITVEISTILQLLQFAGASCNFHEPTLGTGGFKSAPFHNCATPKMVVHSEPTTPTGRFKSVCFEILVQIASDFGS
ncbi:hypothetical protein B0H19DRAFT_1084283 [Mycena capillaripes]|nr:hypothetical protein B0H19DRAFT_1084283 [Mycena capillaripes]